MNVVVVCCDRIPTKLLGCYGSEWVETPNIDRLAAGGVVFDSAFADGRNSEWIAESVVDEIIGSAPSIDVGLLTDRPDHRSSRRPWIVVERGGESDHDSCERLFATAAEWWDEHVEDGGDAFLWLDVALADASWMPPPHWRNRHREEESDAVAIHHVDPARFGAKFTADEIERVAAGWADRVAFFDALLGAFLQSIDETMDEPPWVVFTAEAGEPLGEHGLVGPSPDAVHHEAFHVPLIVRQPNARAAARRAQFMTSTDVARLIAGSFDNGDAFADRPAFERWFVANETESAAVLTTREWKLIEHRSGRVELFARPEDLLDLNDMSSRSPGVVEELTAALQFIKNPDAAFQERST